MSVSTVKATINGQIYNLTLNDSTGKYGSDHYRTVNIQLQQ